MNMNPSVEQAIDARLRAIADELFGPSRDTLAAVALGGEAVLAELPPSMQQRLRTAPFDRTIEIIRNTLADTDQYVQQPFLDPPARGTASLERGQIRVVEAVDLNDPSSPRRYTDPVLVLLDRPVSPMPGRASDTESVWQAWTVSHHAGFAGYWDLLLQGDDVPSACSMVQVWNLVRVSESHLGRCRFELDHEQQGMVDALWLEYLSGAREPDLQDSGLPRWMTAGLRLTTQGAEVVTGSPSFGADDPRFMFQRFYARVRESLAAATSLATPVAMGASQPTAEITETDRRKVAAMLAYSSLIERVKFKGLFDGSLNSTAEILATGTSRYIADRSLTEQAESVWIEWVSYSSKDQEIALGLLEGLMKGQPKENIEFQFRVAFSLRDDEGCKLQEEEFIFVQHQAIEGERGVFLLSTRQPVAERILAGRVDLEVEVLSDGGSKYLARFTIREG